MKVEKYRAHLDVAYSNILRAQEPLDDILGFAAFEGSPINEAYKLLDEAKKIIGREYDATLKKVSHA